jgi:hypothetical protein
MIRQSRVNVSSPVNRARAVSFGPNRTSPKSRGRFEKGRVDGEAVTGLFPPADAVKTLQPRVVLLVY